MRIPHRRFDGLRCEERCRIVCEVLEDGGAHFDFAATFCNALSHFECGKSCQFAFLFEKKLSGAGDDLRAIFNRACCPGNERIVRGGPGSHHLLISMLCEGLKNFSSNWIYAAVWHGELLCSSRDSRPQNRVSRYASSKTLSRT